jgi:hypothetical protein
MLPIVQNPLSSCLLSKKIKTKILKTIILPEVLHWCETSSMNLREEHRLWVFENRVLHRISGPKIDEIIGYFRILHNEELNNLYSLPDIIGIIKSRKLRRTGHAKGEEECI